MSRIKPVLVSDADPAEQAVDLADLPGSSDFEALLTAPLEMDASRVEARTIAGAVVGMLAGFASNGAVPLVTYPDQPGTAALPARSTITLDARHLGRQAVLMFDGGDPYRPLVVGCLVDEGQPSLPEIAGQVDVEADGRRLVVSAKDRIVLRCGKASITLTREGKVILNGEYVSSHSSGVLRLKGGSVQIN